MDGVQLLAEFLGVVGVVGPEHVANLIHSIDYLVVANHEGVADRFRYIQVRNIIRSAI